MINPAETVALRRIALLVTRATEDCASIRNDLVKIAGVIDAMKRSIVLGTAIDKDVTKLSTLIRRLPGQAQCKSANCARLRDSLVNELRELLPHHEN